MQTGSLPPSRNARGQRGARGGAAAGTPETVEVVLGHLGPEWRQFQYLMAQRLRIVACKGLAAPAALRGLENLSVIGWEEGRCRRSCPGWPPGLRPETGRGGRRLTVDRSVEGGREELVEFWFSRSCRSWTCCWSARTLARNSAASACSVRIRARASGDRLSHKSTGSGGPALIRLVPRLYEPPALERRPVIVRIPR